eukprot:CAMPEP_0170552400 /NCGR_PEP_ID=MMETSP0211-20121228/10299_1 /TAXON_ID=311385 /ORGANISM="Pseudokeronopsis sp., Strain OXSARD2" /LENGTH=60 /DNA_ID=CAMNT_0010860107 /DNA_START=1025 /DNA_END=1207 /DNA_ORIENTATION=+
MELSDAQIHSFMTFLLIGMYQSDPKVDPKLPKMQVIINILNDEFPEKKKVELDQSDIKDN